MLRLGWGFDNSEKKKTAFGTVANPSFQTTIQKLRMMSRGTECEIRSGYCSSHNIKVIREVQMKRVSSVDETGRASCSTQEVCPKKPSIAMKIELAAPQGTNGKRRKLFNSVWIQPAQPRRDDRTDRSILLEETR